MMLPSKKVVSLFILTGALVASIVIAFGRDKGSQVINVAQNLVAGEQISLPQNPEWQKELGSVTADIKPSLPSFESASEQTTTDAVSTSLISNYLALKQNDQLNPESAQKLIEQATNFVIKTGDEVPKISKLNVIPDNGTQTIIDYGESLGSILKSNKPSGIKNEIQILTEAIEAGDEEKLGELDNIITIYETLSLRLQIMKVPQKFVKAHLDLTNGVNGMAIALKQAKLILDDPIKGLSSIELYDTSANMFSQSLSATRIFIKENKIIYKQGTGGYYLLYGI